MGRHEEALKILHGGTVIPAIPLVLDENRKFNEAGQRTLIRYYPVSYTHLTLPTT